MVQSLRGSVRHWNLGAPSDPGRRARQLNAQPLGRKTGVDLLACPWIVARGMVLGTRRADPRRRKSPGGCYRSPGARKRPYTLLPRYAWAIRCCRMSRCQRAGRARCSCRSQHGRIRGLSSGGIRSGTVLRIGLPQCLRTCSWGIVAPPGAAGSRQPRATEQRPSTDSPSRSTSVRQGRVLC